MARIELQNLRKTFGQVVAVNDVSLQVEDGEFVALLGPSGCGKTTTLRMVSGLEAPDSGTIRIGDRDVTTLPPRERDIAMVFQDYALYPHMTILDNIGYPLKVRGIARQDIVKQVQSIATNLQIGELLHRRPGQLSGGQQQRTAVARAVVYEAKVFLFDEPLSNLDAKLRLEARAFLKHLQQEVGITSLYVTHDQAEAMALSDKIVVMKDGNVMQVGAPLEIYRRPVNTFVAAFIGNPPMNLLPCRVDDNHLRLLAGQETQSIKIDPAYLPRNLKPNTQFTLGIRPEHIQIQPEGSPEAMQGELYVTQLLGGESLVVVKMGDQLVSIRLFEDEVPPLPPYIAMTVEPQHLFFFDANGDLMQ
jgi:multiple sugar transport system ATP-binding protein